MPDEVLRPDAMRYAFVIYDPPAPGLPWLSVCVGPFGKVYAVEAFDSLERAQARTVECAETFVQQLNTDGQVATVVGGSGSVH